MAATVYWALARKRCWEEVLGSCQSPNIYIYIYLHIYIHVHTYTYTYKYNAQTPIYNPLALILRATGAKTIDPAFRITYVICGQTGIGVERN